MMSDPRPEKKRREWEQVHVFLHARGIRCFNLKDGCDPPDVRVIQDGSPALDIEVREYHAEADRVGVEKRWHQLRAVIDDLIKQRPTLKGVALLPIFQNHRIPSRRHHQEIGDELTRCAEFVVKQGRLDQGGRKLSFQDWVPAGTCLAMSPPWLHLPASEWPTLAKHVSAVTISRIAFSGYLPCNNPQAQTAYSSPYAGAFLTILEEKEDRVHAAIRKGTYSKAESALWLLVVCNTRGDLGSSIFGDWQLKSSVAECGFDFEKSVFEEIWLMDEINGGRSQRLHPWLDRVSPAINVEADI
jgi:hypothetical protein